MFRYTRDAEPPFHHPTTLSKEKRQKQLLGTRLPKIRIKGFADMNLRQRQLPREGHDPEPNVANKSASICMCRSNERALFVRQGTVCVQNFKDSRDYAIYLNYRTLLRSSSNNEPRYPSLKVVFAVPLTKPFWQAYYYFQRLDCLDTPRASRQPIVRFFMYKGSTEI